MNLYLKSLAQAINGAPTYAWLIDTDHLAEAYGDPPERSSVGVCGPSDAPDDLLEQLKAGTVKSWTFRMYDDDGELYYTGRLATAAADPNEDDTGPGGALVAPLDDYGMPGAGCTRLVWVGHPEWEIG